MSKIVDVMNSDNYIFLLRLEETFQLFDLPPTRGTEEQVINYMDRFGEHTDKTTEQVEEFLVEKILLGDEG